MEKGKTMRSVVIVVLTTLLLIVLRLGLDQAEGYRSAMGYLASGDKKNAIMHLDRVLNAHIPFSPLEGKARDRLMAMGSGFEDKGEYELALLCYETIRSSRYLTRSFYLPGREEIRFLNGKIASLKAGLLAKDGADGEARSAYEKQMRLMNKDYSPPVSWSIMVVFLSFSYIAAIAAWALTAGKRYIFAGTFLFIAWIIILYVG